MAKLKTKKKRSVCGDKIFVWKKTVYVQNSVLSIAVEFNKNNMVRAYTNAEYVTACNTFCFTVFGSAVYALNAV